MADDMRNPLVDALRAAGADDEAVASMLGLVDEQSAKLAAADKARDDALGALVYSEVHGFPGDPKVDPWDDLSDDERLPYVAAGKAVEHKLDDEYDAYTAELQSDLESETTAREKAEDALDEIERIVARAQGGA